MKSIKSVVARVFEAVGEEQDAATAYLDRAINHHERTSIVAMIQFRAYELKVQPWKVENWVVSHFGADEIDAIKSREYQRVIEFLVDFKGLN